jgi:CzcA family heavy metal efflux pump
MTTAKTSALGRFAIHHAKTITFSILILCLAGVYAAWNIPSSVFPQTNFPRVVILIDNGVMPGDEMMARITLPIEEAMKDIPGAKEIKSVTGRGSAEISIFFNWQVDMIQSELYVLGRLSEIRATLPAEASTTVWRLTFSAFPIIGVSLTCPNRDITEVWETARYTMKPRFLRIQGVARVDLVGGRAPEYHVVVDPLKLSAAGFGLNQVTEALEKNNLMASAGMHEENYTLYLTVVDGRVRNQEEIENLSVGVVNGRQLFIKDFASVKKGPEPVFNVVTADGVPAVLLNIRSQPDGSTLDIARGLQEEIAQLKKDLPSDYKIAYYYDQSQFVRASVKSVWECIILGLIFSLFILFLFLKKLGSTFVAILVIPITILTTFVVMLILGLSFNLMTLGGIAAGIGLIIDNAIVVVEAIHTKMISGLKRSEAIVQGLGEIVKPLTASTLTPVVVFIPLAFLSGITGVFFRALALTMVVSLLMSLVLAVTITPSLAAWLMREKPNVAGKLHFSDEGFILKRAIMLYEKAIRFALRHYLQVLAVCLLVLLGGYLIYSRLETNFLPKMDEGAFVIDYIAPWGTSLTETDRQLRQAEEIIKATPEVESYSRRTGARLALAVAEPNTGDFLVKLKSDRKRSTEEVISYLRSKFNSKVPGIEWEFPGILGDLIGDLTWSPQPIEIKLYSTDQEFLKGKAPVIEEKLAKIKGIVDSNNGLVYTGSSISLKVRPIDAQRFGMTVQDIADAVNIAMLGKTASSVLEGDRIIDIRVVVDSGSINTIETLNNLPLRTSTGLLIKLSQVADVIETPGQLELRREDLRQDIAVTARLEGRDIGSAMKEIQQVLSQDKSIPSGSIEFGGLYQQQQESFRNLLMVLLMAILLVFVVLLIEFRSFMQAFSIIIGAVLATFGSVFALWITKTDLNVVSFLGVIIGIGIVAKNGILMLDRVDHLLAENLTIEESLVQSGRRRLRPVLMTSLAAMLGMLPLAWGVGIGSDMLRPMAITVIGALFISVLLSLVATPAIYYFMIKIRLWLPFNRK